MVDEKHIQKIREKYDKAMKWAYDKGMMTKEFRNLFMNVFNCDVFDHYGCSELLRMGWECKEHSGYHIEVDNLIMEFLDDDGESVNEGQRGNITGTGLVNKAMPLIRYNVGDQGSFKKELCPCGRGLPLMNILEGRTDDFIVLPSGRMVGPRKIVTGLFPILKGEEIFQIKVTQIKKDRIQVDVVEDREYSKKTVEDLKDILNNLLGEPVEITIKTVDKIPKNKHGKLRTIESKVRMKSLRTSS